MTEFDYAVLIVLVCSALLGVMRGFLKEAFSLVAYAAAGYGAMLWAPRAIPWFLSLLDHYYVAVVIAYLVVFIALLLLIGLINKTIASMISYAGLGTADRGLGILFGLVRGLIIVLLAVLLLGYTDLPNELWWKNAQFSAPLVHMIQQIKSYLPSDIVHYLPY